MSAQVAAPLPTPVEVIIPRLQAGRATVADSQTAYAIIGALEQAGYVLVRKRHFGGKP